MAEDNVEPLPFVQRQPADVSLAPIDPGRYRSRDRQHLRVYIDADDETVLSQAFPCEARHDPGSTGDVKHSIAPCEARAFEKDLCPWPEQGPDEMPFVHLREVRHAHADN
jgi:hypothetical protein